MVDGVIGGRKVEEAKTWYCCDPTITAYTVYRLLPIQADASSRLKCTVNNWGSRVFCVCVCVCVLLLLLLLLELGKGLPSQQFVKYRELKIVGNSCKSRHFGMQCREVATSCLTNFPHHHNSSISGTFWQKRGECIPLEKFPEVATSCD